MAHDNYAEGELRRLRIQLAGGSHLRVYHYGESPAFSFSPKEPSRPSQVRHELAQSLVNSGYVELVESGSLYNVYAMPAEKAAA